LLGLYQPTAGELLIDRRQFSPETSLRIGYLPEERGLYKKETPLDQMIYFGVLKGLSRNDARAKSLEYLNRVGLRDHAATRLDKLSGGQQQKVQLGITVINDPELLILDEPTKGFDPVNRRLLLQIVHEHQARGATVVMITHQMDEAEKLCDRILLLKDGQAAAYGTLVAVKKQFGGKLSLDDIFVKVYSDEKELRHA
jgi:ABC-2 type transport system ATP-binding protein